MIDEEKPAAFLGSSTGARTMADGTLRVQIDISPADAIGAFSAFGAPGSPVALARIQNEAALDADREKVEKPWGAEAQALYKSSFFRTPDVWKAIGTDEEYLDWVRQQPSAKSGAKHYDPDTGKSGCVAAHVRRVEHGSGTAIKPPFSAIPLTWHEHQESHQRGDSIIGNEAWWEKMRIKYVHLWCWETAKIQIQNENPDIECSSFSGTPPILVEGWAMRLGIHHHLPGVYKGHVKSAESPAASEAG